VFGSSTELPDFEEHVRRALDELPPDLAQRLENVAVVVEDEHPGEPDLFGLFEEAPYLPAKVTIYSRPLEEEFGHDAGELEHEIRTTVLHELAHYFGIDEDRLEELGYR
jgi:predicted Zn-dependent protease with MMP-like domain